MKKLILGLIATVAFSATSYANSDDCLISYKDKNGVRRTIVVPCKDIVVVRIP